MPLTPSERESLKYQLEQLDLSLEEVAYEEYQLTQRLSALFLQRRSINCQKARVLNTTNAPIQALPNEILAYIFDLGSANPSPIISQQRTNILAQVCHRFREAAIASPSLWAYVDMREGPPYEKSKTHLERSGACPLNINLDLQNMKFGYWEKQFLSTTLLPHLARSRSLHLSSNKIEPLQILLPPFCTRPARYLEKLEVFYFGDEGTEHRWEDKNSPPSLAFASTAPRLQSLTISGIHPPWKVYNLTTLVEFSFDFHSPDIRRSGRHFAQIIAYSRNLKRLNIMQGGSNLRLDCSIFSPLPDSQTVHVPNSRPPIRAVLLPYLQDLVHTFTESRLACDLFNVISAPNLQSLTMEYVKGDCGSLLELLCGPPLRFPKLTNLRLVGLTTIGAGHMLRFLQSAATNVTNLHLNAVNCPTLKEIAFLLRWMALERREYLMPKLQEVISEGLTPRNLREMVQSRPKGMRPGKITMRQKDWVIPDDENMQWLKDNLTLNLVEGSSDDEDE